MGVYRPPVSYDSNPDRELRQLRSTIGFIVITDPAIGKENRSQLSIKEGMQ